MKTCSFCGKEGRIIKGLCDKHYMQQRLLGAPKRTKFDKNEFIIKDGYAEMLIYKESGQVKEKALIDIEDIERVSKYKWGTDAYGYVVCTSKKLRLHRYLTGARLPDVVDHIEGNPLDNRKSKLKVCSQQENVWNSRVGNGIRKRGKRFAARIKVLGEGIHLGTFDTYEQALEARKEAEKKYRKPT